MSSFHGRAGHRPGDAAERADRQPHGPREVADLFGVSLAAMQATADRLAREPPDVTEAPELWRDTLGVTAPGADYGPPINLRPGPIWRDAVARDVVPALPSRWLARDYELIRLPASPVLCRVLPGDSGGHAVLHPMYIPDGSTSLEFAIEVRTAIADRVPDPIESFADGLTANTLPFFDRYGHPEGLRDLCRERVDGRRVNPHDGRCLAASEVMLGRYAEAADTYSELAAMLAAHSSRSHWAKEPHEEARVRSRLLLHEPAVVHEALIATVDDQLRHLRLPQAPDHHG